MFSIPQKKGFGFVIVLTKKIGRNNSISTDANSLHSPCAIYGGAINIRLL